MFSLDFSGKVVLVTGASRGIGKGIAEAFASLGATVCGTATSQKGADAITEYLNGKGAGFVLNALEEGSIDALFAAVSEKYGAPDILVNNAGITRDGLFMRMKDEDWDAVITCNLSSAARLCRACVSPMMKKRSGRIINISSITGEIGNAGQCNYAAAKAGLIGFSRSLAKEVAPRGITVNCVAPGFIETDMTAAMPESARAAAAAAIPAGRIGRAEDVAAAVAFLAGEQAGYITGQVLCVDGGMGM